MENKIIDDIETSFQSDLEYIKEDIIAQQTNRAYCKYCRPLQCVTKYDMTEEQYTKYWVDKYKKDKARVEKLKEVIAKKFVHYNLTPLEEIIELQKKSHWKDSEEILQHITTTKKAKAPRLDY